MRELDNIAVASLGVLLNENTTLKRFYPLISIKETLVQRLLDAGMRISTRSWSGRDSMPS